MSGFGRAFRSLPRKGLNLSGPVRGSARRREASRRIAMTELTLARKLAFGAALLASVAGAHAGLIVTTGSTPVTVTNTTAKPVPVTGSVRHVDSAPAQRVAKHIGFNIT